jgi:hypothetical protein
MIAPATKKAPEIRKLTLLKRATRSCKNARPLSVSRSTALVRLWKRLTILGTDTMLPSLYGRKGFGS